MQELNPCRLGRSPQKGRRAMEHKTSTGSENDDVASLSRLLASLQKSQTELEALGLADAAGQVERAIHELSASRNLPVT